MALWVRELAAQARRPEFKPGTHVTSQGWSCGLVTAVLWEAEAGGSLEFAFSLFSGSWRDPVSKGKGQERQYYR